MSNIHGQIPPIDWHGSRFTGGLLADMGTPEQDGQVYLTSDEGNNEIYVGLEAGNPASWIRIYPAASVLTVKEVDGAPTVAAVDIIQVTNGKLTDNGDGNVTIDVSGGGGGGGSLSVARVVRENDVGTGGSGDYDIAWESEDYDTITGFALGTSAINFVAPSNGYYQHILMLAAWGSPFSVAGMMNVDLWVNGAAITNFLHYGDGTTKALVTTAYMTTGQIAKWRVATADATVIGDSSLLRTYWEVIKLT